MGDAVERAVAFSTLASLAGVPATRNHRWVSPGMLRRTTAATLEAVLATADATGANSAGDSPGCIT